MSVWGIGQDNVHISRHKAAKEAEAETNFGRKTSICQEGGERGVFLRLESWRRATFSVFLLEQTRLERFRRSREQGCSLAGEKQRN